MRVKKQKGIPGLKEAALLAHEHLKNACNHVDMSLLMKQQACGSAKNSEPKSTYLMMTLA